MSHDTRELNLADFDHLVDSRCEPLLFPSAALCCALNRRSCALWSVQLESVRQIWEVKVIWTIALAMRLCSKVCFLVLFPFLDKPELCFTLKSLVAETTFKCFYYVFRHLVPIIAALEYNTWFTKLNCSNVRLVSDKLINTLKTMIFLFICSSFLVTRKTLVCQICPQSL